MRAGTARRSSHRSGRHADDENFGAVGRRDQAVRLGNDGRAGRHRDAGKAGADGALDRLRADRWADRSAGPGLAWAPSPARRCRQARACGRSRAFRATRASMASVPSAASTASTCLSGDHHRLADIERTRRRADNRSRARCRRGRARTPATRPSAPSGTRISGATSCAPSRRNPSCSTSWPTCRQQMIVAAAIRRRDTRQHHQRREVGTQSARATAAPTIRSTPRRGSLAARARREELAELAEIKPVMRDSARPRPDRRRRAAGTARTVRPRAATESATASGRLPPPQIIASGASRLAAVGGAHASSSASSRLTAMVNGRFPARMKSIDLARPAHRCRIRAATRSSRARNSPSPKNSAS